MNTDMHQDRTDRQDVDRAVLRIRLAGDGMVYVQDKTNLGNSAGKAFRKGEVNRLRLERSGDQCFVKVNGERVRMGAQPDGRAPSLLRRLRGSDLDAYVLAELGCDVGGVTCTDNV